MRLLEVLENLRKLDVPTFQTTDAAAMLGIDRAHASQLLGRLAHTNHVIRLKRGLWAFPDKVKSIQLPELILAPLPCYISLQTALYLHGLIEQVPEVIYVVSLARTQKIRTPLGTISVHHIDQSFFFGFEKDEKVSVNIATPEKALIDFLYLSQARSGLFKSLTEIERIPSFSMKRAQTFISKISASKRRQLVKERLHKIHFH